MQFSVGYICILAVLITCPVLQGVDAADAKAATGSAGKSAGTPAIISVVHGFLKEEIPPSATGTVSHFLADYLKKCTEGGGGAAGGKAGASKRALPAASSHSKEKADSNTGSPHEKDAKDGGKSGGKAGASKRALPAASSPSKDVPTVGSSAGKATKTDPTTGTSAGKSAGKAASQ